MPESDKLGGFVKPSDSIRWVYWLEALSHIFFKFHHQKLQNSAGFQLLQHINCNMWNYPASSRQFCTSVMNRCGDKWGVKMHPKLPAASALPVNAVVTNFPQFSRSTETMSYANFITFLMRGTPVSKREKYNIQSENNMYQYSCWL